MMIERMVKGGDEEEADDYADEVVGDEDVGNC